MDAFLGSLIIFFALMIIMTSSVTPTKIDYNYELAEDYATFLITTKLEDISTPYTNEIVLAQSLNPKTTLMEQISKYYYTAKYDCAPSSVCEQNAITNATLLIGNATSSLIPEKFSFSYTILDHTLGTQTALYERENTPLEQARIVISSRKATFVQMNATTMFGPEIAEIKVWI